MYTLVTGGGLKQGDNYAIEFLFERAQRLLKASECDVEQKLGRNNQTVGRGQEKGNIWH